MIITIEPTPDFREGFEFAVKSIHDVFKNDIEYPIDKMDQLLTSIRDMIDKGFWWDGIKGIIIQDEKEIGEL